MNFKLLCTAFVLLVVGASSLSAQETTAATGGNASGAGGVASFTVGQTAYAAFASPNGSFSEGVQQAYEISGPVGVDGIDLELSAYPNPTKGALYLNVDNWGGDEISYQLYDFQGRLMAHEQTQQSKSEIEMNGLAVGIYTLSVFKNNTLIKTFKVVKN